jgi:hypothetical protein
MQVTGRALNRYNAWAAIWKRAKAAGNRHHHLPGKRRSAGARPAHGWP